MNYEDFNIALREMDKVPYPRLETLKPEVGFTKELYNSYAGTAGEFTAITQYVYENITYEDKGDIAKTIMCVAIQEMKHFKILGEILAKHGCVPYIMGSRNNKWCSDNVKYRFDSIKEMMKYNINSEEEAIKEYKRLIEKTCNGCIKGIIARIILDEENHIRIFKEILKHHEGCK